MNSNEVISIIDELTKRISGPAEEVFHIFVRQMIAYGVADILGAALLIIGCLIGVKFIKKYELEDEGLYISVIFIILALMLAGGLIISGSLFLISPEFYAIRDLIGNVK